MDDKRVYISSQGAWTASEAVRVRQARGRTVSTPSKNRFARGWQKRYGQLAGTFGEDEWK
jgi:hypothetical protein